jgi:hypothetical protein
MIKNTIVLTFLAAAAITLAACTTSSLSSSENRGAPGSAASLEGQEPASAAATYNQPLMATGGDLVMLRILSRDIAG